MNLFSDESTLKKGKLGFYFGNNTLIRPYNSIDLVDRNIYQSELLEQLKNYKEITNEIENHLKNEKFSLYHLKEKFIGFFKNDLKKNLTKKSEKKELETLYNKNLNELKKFIKIFSNLILNFYEIPKEILFIRNLNYSLFTNENICNFITSIVFQNEELYKLILKFQTKIDEKRNSEFKKILNYFKDFKPEFFGVPEIFCLNEKTLKFIKESPQHKNNQIDRKFFFLINFNLKITLINIGRQQSEFTSFFTIEKNFSSGLLIP